MISNIKGAFSSIWNNKVTSLLTILGVVIGVTSVIVLISLGQGLKNDVSSLIQGLGSNIMGVIGGKIDAASMQGGGQVNPAQFIATDILTEKDLQTIQNTDGVQVAAPMSLVSSTIKYNEKIATPLIMGTTSQFIETVGILKLESGRVFDNNSGEKSIIIASNTKEALFGNNDPIGKRVMISDTGFTVVGLLKKPSGSVIGGEYDNMTLIPFDAATALNKNQVKIYRIMVKAADNSDPKAVKETLTRSLLKNHNNEENFSVLTQDDLLGLFDQFLDLATTMVTAIAAISLIVGGIGIMNIMLITVTERTREIGLRKAVGASKSAIMTQFLVEATIITLLGGLLGLAISFAATYIIEAKSTLNPEITVSTIILSLGISTIIGILFGLWPALRAAQKDPIEALRRE